MTHVGLNVTFLYIEKQRFILGRRFRGSRPDFSHWSCKRIPSDPSTCSASGFQYREQTGLDQTHPRGDPGAHRPPARSSEGAHPHPQNRHSQTQRQTVSRRFKSVIFPSLHPWCLCMLMFVCREGEELDSQGDASSQPDTISIASRTSQNTVDSDKVRKHSFYFPPTSSPKRPSCHLPVHLVSTWFLCRRTKGIAWINYGPWNSVRGKDPWNGWTCTEVSTFVRVCVRERILAYSDRSIFVKSGINTTDGLSSYAQYEHRKHTHVHTQANIDAETFIPILIIPWAFTRGPFFLSQDALTSQVTRTPNCKDECVYVCVSAFMN